jgi:ABC-type branched-subunit amino acid transport system permease subunit
VTQHLQYLLLGLGGGAVLAALALGLVLTFRASGVLNLAHAAMGMFSAFTYFQLRANGEILNPLPFGPNRIPLLPGKSFEDRREIFFRFKPGTALLITLGLAALYGFIVYWLAFRPLREAPALAKVVSSLGLLLYLLAIAKMRLSTAGASGTSRESLLPSDVVELAGVQIQQDRLWLTGLVIVITAGLAALYHYTRFGLATRAAAESEKGAVLVGLSPTALASLNWMLSAMLAAGAVILIAPISGLDATTTSMLVVPALAAALVGKFKSFTVTAGAALGIGMLQSEILNLRTEWSWLPNIDLQTGVPLLVIILTMVLRGESLPTRATLHEGRFPRSPSPRRTAIWAVVLGVVASVAMLGLDSHWRSALIVTCTTALIALSVVVLTGYVGQISLMPMALAGVAAFTMIRLSADWGLPFPVAPILASLLAVAVGLVAGVPAVRVRGMNLAIATLAAAVAIEQLLLKWDTFTGGAGGSRVPAPDLFGFDLGVSAAGADFPRKPFGLLVIAVLVLIAVVVANLRSSVTGLRWLAVRNNERAAASSGLNVRAIKLQAFAVSSFIAGLGGCLYAYGHQDISADSFVVFQSLALLAITYLSGIASVAGALLAGVFADGGLLTAASGGSGSEMQFAIQGLVLMVMAAAYPDGLTGAAYAVRDRIAGRQRGRSGAGDQPAEGAPSGHPSSPASISTRAALRNPASIR